MKGSFYALLHWALVHLFIISIILFKKFFLIIIPMQGYTVDISCQLLVTQASSKQQ